MSVEDIKSQLAVLSSKQQDEVSAFLFQLRHASDPAYQERVESRLADTDSAHWVTPEEFERRLDQR